MENNKITIEQQMEYCNKDDEWFQKGCQNVIARHLAFKEYFEILKKEDETFEQVLNITPAEQLERLKLIRLSLENHEQTVKQNKNLQSELRELKKQPFFPYALNSGNRTDFGEFYLISHAWFSISNFPIQLGIVEVEWKSSGVRKMYLGAGSTNGKDFKKDVLSITLHGQKIKDSSEV